MSARVPRSVAMVALAVLVAGCSGGSGDPQRQGILRSIGLRQPPPDEFLVLERKRLEMPPALTELPPPNPDGVNRVDPRPREEVNALLKGAGLTAAREVGPSPGETALLAGTGADTADPAIRATLAAEDQALQSGQGRYALRTVLGRRTWDPYRNQVLDPHEELQRLRAQGVPTPAAPPPPPKPEGIRLF